jgi:hypothetical protein
LFGRDLSNREGDGQVLGLAPMDDADAFNASDHYPPAVEQDPLYDAMDPLRDAIDGLDEALIALEEADDDEAFVSTSVL